MTRPKVQPKRDLSSHKRCEQCAADIPAEARICSHCQSYQDWRSRLPFSSLVLALIVAGLSVASTAIPPIAALFHSPTSRISFTNPVVRGEELYLVATNAGDRPGVVYTGELHGDHLATPVRLDLPNPAGAFIGPGAKQIAFQWHFLLSAKGVASLVDAAGARDRSDKSYAVILVGESDGTQREVRVPLPAPAFHNLLMAHFNKCINAELQKADEVETGCISLDEAAARSDAIGREVDNALRGRPKAK